MQCKIIEDCKQCCISPNSFEVLATEDSNTEKNNNLDKEFVANERNSTNKKLLLCADSHLVWSLNKIQQTHKAVGYIRRKSRTNSK